MQVDLKLALFIAIAVLLGSIGVTWRLARRSRHTLSVGVGETLNDRLIRRHQAFLGHLSHELRTPLTAVIAHNEIVRSSAAPEDVRRSSADVVQREAHRMARLVRDLLELHRLETTSDLLLQPINLVLLVEDVLAQVILLAEEQGLVLTLAPDAALPLVLAQPDRLKQAFLIVLDNAIKYCRPGDTILVCLRRAPDGIECEVRDTGAGISPTELLHVTERLYRGSHASAIEGSGLGLALVEEILRHHHTRMTIESSTTPDASGTTVRWTLPYATLT